MLGRTEHWLPLVLLLITLVFWAGFMAFALRGAALSGEASGAVVVVFPPQRSMEQMFNAVLLSDGQLVNSTWFDSAWVVYSEQPGFVRRLKAAGAWAAFKPSLFSPITVAGCFLVVDTRTR